MKIETKFILALTVQTVFLSLLLVGLYSPPISKHPLVLVGGLDRKLEGEVYTRSFFRYTKIEGSNYVGNTTFDSDIYLIGAQTIACSSNPQVYEITIRSGPMDPTIDITQPYDINGCAPFDWVSKIYFMLRINSTKGVNADRVFLPYGYAIFIPEGEFIHFNMGSQEYGSGGSFTLYYMYPE